jgi:hypothetical protein
MLREELSIYDEVCAQRPIALAFRRLVNAARPAILQISEITWLVGACGKSNLEG